ncbi:hypothetical protein JOD45_001022 [Scopulibacillus daqui]|uniref:EcsC family protein n=2 Tax=Bacteria TaxID=2 RepID=A0ABS2PYN2_9BACL|nr:hypothetical protein [Scopulibacillus daqui]
MALSETEQAVFSQIKVWEEQFFTYEPTDFTVLYQEWVRNQLAKVSPKWQSSLSQAIDQMVFQCHALLQSTSWQQNARTQLINEGKALLPEINHIEDMKKLNVHQLHFIAQKHIGKQRLISTVQGGLTGTGGFLLLGLDIPLLFSIQMYTVQLIALTYGYEVTLPAEMVTALKVFEIGLLPKQIKRSAWQDLEDEVIHTSVNPYFYEGQDDVMNLSWVDTGIKQLGKTIVISQLKKKIFQGIPLMGMAFGAGFNYRSTKHITEIAHRFYQKRYLMEKAGEGRVSQRT